MARLQLVLAFVLLGALVAAGTFLPARIADSLDDLLLKRVEAPAPVSDYEAPPTATPLIDRLKLLSAPDFELMTLPLQTGGHLDREVIGEILNRELKDLRSRGLYPTTGMIEEASDAYTHYTAEASLYILPAQPDINGIIWSIRLEDESSSCHFYLDDESEKLLGYSGSCEGAVEDLFSKQSGEHWVDYLGLSADSLRVTKGGETAAAEELPPVPPLASESSIASPDGSIAPDDRVVDLTAIPEKSYTFRFETKASFLEFFCGQVHYEEITYTYLQFRS
jgi:hypothetical protein